MSISSLSNNFNAIRKKLFYLIFLLPVAFFFLHVGEVPFPKGSEFTDLLISHYPNGHFLRRSILEQHVIPLWNPGILSGAPFLENPLSGFWYLPGWLALIWDSPASWFLLETIHLVWGGLGMFLFLRREGCSKEASILGGLSFELMPKVIAHLAAGHVSLVFAISWTPWLLLAEIQSRKSKKIFMPGLIWALIIFADIRWAAYAIILWFLFMLRKTSLSEARCAGDRFSFPILFRQFYTWIIQVFFALGVSAPFLIPFYKFVKLSTRTSLGIEESMELSLPPKFLLGFLFPDFGGYAEWIVYFGGIALLVLIFSLGYAEYRRKNLFWLALFCFCMLLSLGSMIPGLDSLFSLPGIRLLRVPTRFLFLGGFSLSVMAAHLIDSLARIKENHQSKHLSFSIIGMVIVVSFEMMLSIGVAIITHSFPQEFFWGAGILMAYGLLIIVWLKTRFLDTSFPILIVIITLIDFGMVGMSQFDFEKWENRVNHYTELLDFFYNDTEAYRIYSPSYSIPQDIASYGRLELADGVDPLQLQGYSEYMEKATGVNSETYSVTVPAFKNGNPKIDNRNAIPDLSLLGRLNIKYILSEFVIDDPGLEFVKQFGQSYLYRNPFFQPRVWVEREGDRDIVTSDLTYQSINPNNIKIKIGGEGPGRVILSEINYPNWIINLDGVKVEEDLRDKLLRAVTVEDGPHIIEWKFIPYEIYTGIGIALVTCLLAVVIKYKKLLGE
jgi:hypothetical protein